MYGWTGKILRIDLTRGNCSVEDLPPELARNYIGGQIGRAGTVFFLMRSTLTLIP